MWVFPKRLSHDRLSGLLLAQQLRQLGYAAECSNPRRASPAK